MSKATPPADHTQAMLAAATGTKPDVTEIILLIAALLGMVILLAIILIAVRKATLNTDEATADLGLTLHDLRIMRDEGRITEAEYESMKAVIIPATRQAHPDVDALRRSRGPATETPDTEAPPAEESPGETPDDDVQPDR